MWGLWPVKILTAAETAAIEAAVPRADAARTDVDLAAIPAFGLSQKAPIWCELVATHVYPLLESEVALRAWIGFEAYGGRARRGFARERAIGGRFRNRVICFYGELGDLPHQNPIRTLCEISTRLLPKGRIARNRA